MNALRFDGKVALITGAGRAYARLLAARGCLRNPCTKGTH
jgi:NAD(P)-dependent dehydrogenase (short-subunit alcohol dehydrogenase family)